MFAFLDTNVHLEFLDFTQIDWRSLLDAETVHLVVPPVVLRELDEHKYDRRSKRRQQRSRKIVKKLTALLLPAGAAPVSVPGRQGVYLLGIAHGPVVTDVPGLVAGNNDDELIASVLKFLKDHKDVTPDGVVLVSDDAGALLKARAYQIPVHQMQDEFRLKEEPADEELKLRDLQVQIDELRGGRMAKLALEIGCGTGRGAEVRVERPFRMKYVPGDEARPRSIVEVHRHPIDPHEVAAAARDLDWGVRVQPFVANRGPASATNIDLLITVPKPYVAKDARPYVPSLNPLWEVPRLGPMDVLGPVRFEGVQDEQTLFRLRYRIKTLVHSTEEDLPEFFLLFRETEELGSQTCRFSYRLVADQAEASTGELAVTLHRTGYEVVDVSYEQLRRLTS